MAAGSCSVLEGSRVVVGGVHRRNAYVYTTVSRGVLCVYGVYNNCEDVLGAFRSVYRAEHDVYID